MSPHVELATLRSEELAQRATAGCELSFGELVARHEGSLVRFLRTRTATRADAEELAHEVFVHAWRKLAHYDAEQPFPPWLFTLARNFAISRARRRRKTAEGDEALAMIGVQVDPSRAEVARETASGLWALADRVLTPEQREALWLRYAEDLSAEEIGAVLGKRAVAVRVLLFRARECLERQLALDAERRGHQRPASAPVSAREVWS
jgi:RNA polymerase sigma-70 factor (ECF subfamily)